MTRPIEATAIRDWDDAYANGAHIAEAAAYPPRWAAQASAFRDQLVDAGRAKLDESYGATQREVLDLFLPEGAPRGLVVFIHGGYWRAFDKSSWSHLAAGAVNHGWAVAMPSYTLCPEARIATITMQMGAAITHAASLIDGPVRLTGHSAGGHLVSRMCCENAPLPVAVQHRLEHVVSISGVHDLRPLLRTAMNDAFGMDEVEAASESPVLLIPRRAGQPTEVSLCCWVGAEERPEFIRQNELLANIWRGLGVATSVVTRDDKHHFSVLDDLTDPSSRLVANLLGLGGA
jgi:arylformamidase